MGRKYFCLIFAVILFLSSFGKNGLWAGDLIPFALPWDDAEESITNMSHLLDPPAGKYGFIRIKNGHFVDGSGKRFRILGVNNSFSGNFPTHEQADAVAARLAKFGINCVRFHHTDTRRAPNGIWKAGTEEKQQLDPVQLDRLDYFIAALKRHGIYSNINLKIGREAVEADGIPFPDRLPTYDKGPDHYFPRLIELQKNYARDLLTHRNPYTGKRYIEEPAIATIEINNESGLVNKWHAGVLDDLPDVYLKPLQEDWNNFLRNKYGTTEKLLEAWTPERPITGEELLKRGLRGWILQQIAPATGKRQIVAEGPEGQDALKITTTSTSQESWHIQILYHDISLQKGAFYKFTVWLRSDPARDVSIGIRMDHSPWEALDSFVQVDLTTGWRKYEFNFSPVSTESDARLDISDLADELGAIWVAEPSFREAAPITISHDESLENATVKLVLRKDFGSRSQRAGRDFIEFLVDRESAYYRDMVNYLHGELGAGSPVAGTQLGFGVLPSQMENDFIDIHGYWQHPVFPGRPWDPSNWFVRNRSIVNEVDSVLTRLMMSRVDGRAFTVSEYNHPAPNTYSSEGIPLIAAYGAFQDWDGIYFYSYSHNNQYSNKSINHFFDIYGHTPKMLAVPIAANLFLRGDIKPGRELVTSSVSREEFIDFLTERGGSTWRITSAEFGIPETTPYLHRTALRFGADPRAGEGKPAAMRLASLQSDTSELEWNHQKRNQSFVLIRAEKTKGFIGFVAEPVFDLGHGVKLQVGETIQNWANVLLSFIRSAADGDHWLLVATGYAENTGMKWTSDAKESVGRQWGTGPPLVETIPLTLSFENSEGRLRLFALDNRGKRSREVGEAIRFSEGRKIIDLMSSQPSLWYEILFEKANVSNCQAYR